MLESPRGRFGALVVILGALFGLFVWYGSLGPAPGLGVYPHEGDYLSNPDPYLGEKVTVGGRVVDTDPVTVEAESDGEGSALVRVEGVSHPVARGDKLRAFGTLTGPRTVRADHSFAVPRSGLWYTWSVSFLAGLWVLGLVVRHWRFDPGSVALVPREEPLTPADLGGRDGPTDHRDAADHRDDGGNRDA